MKKTVSISAILAFTFLLLSFPVNYVHSQWVKSNGPYGGIINCITSSDANIFVGTSGGGIFLSTNNGTNWNEVNNGLTDLNVDALAVSGSYIFAGTNSSGVFLSTNNGLNWTNVSNGIIILDINELLVSGSYIYAGTEGGGVYRSTDNGANWNYYNINLGSTFITGLAVLGVNLFAGTYDTGVYFSSNNGFSWTAVNSGLTDPNILCLTVSGTNLFAGTQSGIFISTNNGSSWTAVNSGLTSTYVRALKVSDANLYAGTQGGVFLSNDNGANWTAVNNGITNLQIYSLGISGTNALAGTGGNGVFLTTNNGTNWSEVNNGITSLSVYAFAYNESNLFAGTYGGGAFLSTNYGLNWNTINSGLTNKTVTSFSYSGSNLFAGTYGGGVFLTTNNGMNWTAKNTGLVGSTVNALAVLGTDIYAGIGNNGGVYKSTNNASSWTAVNSGLTNKYLSALAVSGTNLFAGTTNNGGMFLTTNSGVSWTAVSSGLSNRNVKAIAINGTNIFAGTQGGGVFLSTNNGTNWSAVNSGLTNLQVFSLAASGDYLFAGTVNGGVFVSTNNGTNWTQFNDGFTTIPSVYSLLRVNDFVFSGTMYKSVWTFNLAAVPDTPSLVSPAHNSLEVSTSPVLTWLRDNTSSLYNVIVATDSNFTNIILNDSLLTDTLKSVIGLSEDTYYFWKVRGKNSMRWGPFSTFNKIKTYSSWIQLTNGMGEFLDVYSLTNNGNYIFAGTLNDGIYLSTNFGTEWFSADNGVTTNSIRSMTSFNGSIFAGTVDAGVFKSANNGINWSASNTGLTGMNVTALINSENILYAGTWGSGVFISSDYGANWSAINSGLTNLTIYSLAKSGNNLFAGTFNGGVFLSADNGGNWTQVNSGLTNLRIWSLTSDGSNVFAGSLGGGVFLTTNNGLLWNPVNSGLTNFNVTSLSYNSGFLFAGTSDGLNISTNSGTNWIPMNQGLAVNTSIYSLLMTNNYIFAGTGAKSVWRRDFALVEINPPVLVSPANYSLGNQLDLNLVWTKPASSNGFNVVLSTDSLFSSIVINDSLLIDSVKSLTGLSPLTKYFWKVRAKYSGRWSTFSSYNSFKTLGSPTQLNLISPENYAVEQHININFQWSKAIDQTLKIQNTKTKNQNDKQIDQTLKSGDSPLTISDYWFEYSPDSLFVISVLRDSTLSDTVKSVYGLNTNSRYYWRVRAKNETGWGAFSSAWSFSTTYTTDSINPSFNKLNVPLTSEVKAFFHQSINSLSVDTNNVTLFSSMSGKKRTTVLFDSPGNSMLLTSVSPFKYGENITIILDSGIKTGSGSSIVPFVWSFKTASYQSNFILNQANTFSTAANPYRIATGDIDGDGDLDMIVLHDGSAGNVRVYKNNGSGVFSQAATFSVGGNIYGMTTGDIDSDGDIDLAFTNNYTRYAAIYKNNGTGSFSLSSTLSLGNNPFGIEAGDLDGDGYLDLAVTNSSANTVMILKNNRSGDFTLYSTLALGGSPKKIKIGDYDNNGSLDIAVTNTTAGSVLVLKNNGLGDFSILSSVAASNTAGELISDDLDGDGDLDLAVTYNVDAGTLKILKNNGVGTFTVSSTIGISHPTGIGVCDLDGDGDLDLGVTNSWGSTVSTFINNGTGSFSLVSNVVVGSSPEAIASGDFNNDGVMDMAVTNRSSSSTSVLINLTPPNLLSPADNSTGQPSTVLFTWQSSLGASNYRFQLAMDSLFTNLIVNDSLLTSGDLSKNITGLNILTTYYWRLNSKSANGISLWSEVREFKTMGSPLLVNLISPVQNSVNQPVNLMFKWNRTTDQTLTKSKKDESAKNDNADDFSKSVSNYWFELAFDSLFVNVLITDSTLTDTIKTVSGLSNNADYYWRVKAKNDVGWNDFSSFSKFSTIKQPDISQFAIPLSGQGTTSFGSTFLLFISNVTLPRYILVSYYTVPPVTGLLPDGINSISNYFWSIEDSGTVFTGGYLRIPLSFLGGITDPTKLRWLKRSSSGDNWIDIGGIIQDGYLVSTVPFSSFSEFAIGSQDVQPLTSTNIKIIVIPEGFYDAVNNRLNCKDTFKVYLREITSPFAYVDSAVSIIDSLNFTAFFEFKNAPTGTYYIEIHHRNSLQTWSKSGGMAFTKSTSMTYDLSTGQNMAFGDNMILKGTKWCIYSGDVNQDGYVDANDRSIVWNDRNKSGYYAADVNGDGAVDALDRSICWNNRNKAVQRPPSDSFIFEQNKLRENSENNTEKQNKTSVKLDGSNIHKRTKENLKLDY
ncbi:MAG: FG-GAP-like repeat-containing protein [Candidatus Kapaibacterium sp.]